MHTAQTGIVMYDEGDTHSEPSLDPLALENAAKNQAMLTESSQQMLQLGGQHASWNLGGSVESMDPAHIVVMPSANDSNDNLGQSGVGTGDMVGMTVAGGGASKRASKEVFLSQKPIL